ncbi:LysE family translocator [Dokdonella sp. MW10]|uniref:LysE family translocator n=1 Tax=Dokdonella sp. MW10 TaxID=2992926 RepID=UPI003F81C548
MDTARLTAFVATCLLVSLTPGLCAMLCMNLATTLGLRRTQWMMAGEVVGMGSVAVAAMLGIAATLHVQPWLFGVFKLAGSAYLIVLGCKAWTHARGGGQASVRGPRSRLSLAGLGFTTAVTNPKVWALYVALLPPFIDPSRPLAAQLAVMLAIIVAIELAALYAYAFGGRALARLHEGSPSRLWIDRIIGSLMIAMGVWMLVENGLPPSS